MASPPVRVDLRPDSPARSALATWRGRLDALLAAPPPWLEVERARVGSVALSAVPVGPMLLLGFGGSALGARAALESARASDVRILDTLDVAVVQDALEWASERSASLAAVSKSGRTVEVLALLRPALARGLGPRFLLSDPPRGPMDALMGEHTRFEIPAAIGGRYSVFTAVGQVPLRAAGLDPHALSNGAELERGLLAGDADHLLRVLAWRVAHPAAISVVWSYAQSLLPWVGWLQQLECESLGRARPGAEPAGEMVVPLRGPADQHSVAQLLIDGPASARVTILDFETEAAPEDLQPLSRLRAAARDATFEAMVQPSARVLVRDRELPTLGALMLDAMVGTVLLAEHLCVDPYGQPAVETIKTRVAARMHGRPAP